ncbi:MAG TPA: hypothetical protein VJ600_02175 [Holophagaceae bacterium]|nr:hypothetical protein [Holophagaceae bacterium]
MLQGEAQREWPMGSLAKLVWLKVAGADWERRDVRFHCAGHWQGIPCWNRQGHGDVDLGLALRDSCNLAFLAWARDTVARWKAEQGEAAARARLEAAFRPFLGDRLPEGNALPVLDAGWVGDGLLLRTSPSAMAAWLADPAQAPVRERCARLLADEELRGWWIKTGTGAVPSDAEATSAWSAGSDGDRILVLHLPRGHGKAEGITRFRALAGAR